MSLSELLAANPDYADPEMLCGRCISHVNEFLGKICILAMPHCSCVACLFGSVRLQCISRTSDLDFLVIYSSRETNRETLFEAFHRTLKLAPEVTSIYKIEDSYVPLIRFCFGKVPVDLIFSCVDLDVITPDIDILNSKRILSNASPECVRSLNGPRVTESILKAVEQAGFPLETFQTALKALKLFTRESGIDGNSEGFLGGVNCAILVAYVCQKGEFAKPASEVTGEELLEAVFKLFGDWDWRNPIRIKAADDTEEMEKVFPHLRVPVKEYSIAILTPCFPISNSTHNVGRCTARIISAAFQAVGGAKSFNPCKLLQSRYPFFLGQYHHFIVIKLSASNQQDMESWKAFSNTKLRKFWDSLESADVGSNVEGIVVRVVVRPWPEWKKSSSKPAAGIELAMLVGLTLEFREAQKGKSSWTNSAEAIKRLRRVDLTAPWRAVALRLNENKQRKPGMDVSIEVLSAKQAATQYPPPVPSPVADTAHTCLQDLVEEEATEKE